MAIIDILTPYDAKKKAAHAAKTVKHGVSFLCLHLDPVGGSSDPWGGDQEEQPAWLPGVLSAITPHSWVKYPACFSLCSLALRTSSPLMPSPRAAGHVMHLVDRQ